MPGLPGELGPEGIGIPGPKVSVYITFKCVLSVFFNVSLCMSEFMMLMCIS